MVFVEQETNSIPVREPQLQISVVTQKPPLKCLCYTEIRKLCDNSCLCIHRFSHSLVYQATQKEKGNVCMWPGHEASSHSTHPPWTRDAH